MAKYLASLIGQVLVVDLYYSLTSCHSHCSDDYFSSTTCGTNICLPTSSDLPCFKLGGVVTMISPDLANCLFLLRLLTSS